MPLFGGCDLREGQHPGWTAAKYGHYNSCGISSGRKPAHQTGSQESWELFRDVRNQLKVAICRACETFTRQALSSNKPEEEWRIIHRILKPNQQPLRRDPDKLNSFFACTAERTLPVSSDLPFCF